MSDDRTKIVFDLPNHWAIGSESVWARPLGNDTYEVRNVPFYAYGVNFLDVVHATAEAPDQLPVARHLVRSGGHTTVRLFFSEKVSRKQAVDLLDAMKPMHVSYEGANARYVALDLAPEADIAGVRRHLDGLETMGFLEYETCEERVPGSFDGLPEE